jgi:hypothetical protein
MDFPRNAIAVLTGIVKVWLLNEPSADGASSAANADRAQVASAATIRVAFIDDLLAWPTILYYRGCKQNDETALQV